MNIIFNLSRPKQFREAEMEITVKSVLNILCHSDNLHCCRSGTPSFWTALSSSVACLLTVPHCLSLVLGRCGITSLPDLGGEPEWLFSVPNTPHILLISTSLLLPRCPGALTSAENEKNKNNETSELLSDVSNSQAPSSKECLSFSKEPHSRTGSRARASYWVLPL